MPAVDESTQEVTGAVTGAVTGRVFESLLGSLELATVYLGVRLGLYAALAAPRTAAGLAEATGTDERYAREWLEQQAIAGLVTVVEDGDAAGRVYGLDAEQSATFGDDESPLYAGAMALLVGGLAEVMTRLPDTYRTGQGIPFGAYGDDVRIGQALFNRAGWRDRLAQEWVPALPGVGELLSRAGARAVDLGCGTGFSSVALATAYPARAAYSRMVEGRNSAPVAAEPSCERPTGRQCRTLEAASSRSTSLPPAANSSSARSSTTTTTPPGRSAARTAASDSTGWAMSCSASR
jgi:hypothetical protein